MKQSYLEALENLSKMRPRLADALLRAERARCAHAEAYAGGVRLGGLDEWLRYLDSLAESLRKVTTAPRITFLIERARADYETAIEATLSGYSSVAHDAMRDVMEIEFLLRDFAAEPRRLGEWLTANKEMIRSHYQPRHLRGRHAARLGAAARDLPEAADYAGHSVALHVNPRTPAFLSKGIVYQQAPFGVDMCFWEMFEHARRLTIAVFDLLRTPGFEGIANPDPDTALPEVARAWERTQEMQQIFVALIKGHE